MHLLKDYKKILKDLKLELIVKQDHLLQGIVLIIQEIHQDKDQDLKNLDLKNRINNNYYRIKGVGIGQHLSR